MLSHELRTPLTPALMRISSVTEAANVPPELMEDLRLAKNDIEMEARLIDDLLDVSRIIRGKLEPHLEPADLREIIHRAVQVCEPEIQARELHLSAQVPEAPIPVIADPVRLQQVFWNVLRNAVKFNKPGGEICVQTRAGEEEVSVAIADTGMGIEPERIATIFDPFEQGGSQVTRRYGGLGLGMAISKGIVEAHHGAIHVQSAGLDRGATFTIVLPVSRGPVRRARQLMPSAGKLESKASNGRARRILLVEDHDATRSAMSKLLGALGYELHTAASAREALDKAAREKFDLVISDLGLPDMAGHELMRQLAGRGLKGIAVSGFGMEQDQARSREAGFLRHLTKPITIQALREAVETVLAS